MTIQVTPQRLGTLLRPRSVALVGAADKSGFSLMAYATWWISAWASTPTW